MKLLINPSLDRLSASLSGTRGEARISTRIESYSCKMTGDDKRLFKQLSSEKGTLAALEQLSPSPSSLQPSNPWDHYPFGSTPPSGGAAAPSAAGAIGRMAAGGPCMVHTCSRKTLFYLKATLNAVFPDYDFSDAKSHEFSKEPSVAFVKRTIIQNMTTAFADFPSAAPTVWKAIAEAISDTESEVYAYNPDLGSDPFSADGCLWSFNYFWYNKKLKRILFFRGRAVSLNAPYLDDEAYVPDEFDMMDDDLDMEL